MAHEAGAVQRMALPIGDQAAQPGGKRHIEEAHLGAEYSHAHQATGQQHQTVPRQGQEHETRFEKEDHHQAGDEQTDGLHLNKLIKVLMPYGKQHVLHLE
ncbi:hypothetical protein D3C80_1827830 [compost metagenome]